MLTFLRSKSRDRGGDGGGRRRKEYSRRLKKERNERNYPKQRAKKRPGVQQGRPFSFVPIFSKAGRNRKKGSLKKGKHAIRSEGEQKTGRVLSIGVLRG